MIIDWAWSPVLQWQFIDPHAVVISKEKMVNDDVSKWVMKSIKGLSELLGISYEGLAAIEKGWQENDGSSSNRKKGTKTQ